ncbi:MAG: DUF5688 family protein [Eubacteriales bacterium]
MEYRQMVKFEECKKYIYVKLVNSQRNSELLKVIPHLQLYDLSMIFYTRFNKKDKRDFIISDEELKKWNTSVKELEKIAKENTKKQFPFCIREIGKMYAEMIEDSHPIQENKKDSSETDYQGKENMVDINGFMYLLTNESYTFGAVYMMYPEVMEGIGKRMGESYYILPASVNGVILLPKSTVISLKSIQKVVKELNREMVAEEEYLSDYIYYYDKGKKKILLIKYLEDDSF